MTAPSKSSKTRRIGLLTGGGDCPGLNAVLWAVVNACERGGVEVLGIPEGFEGLVETGGVRRMGSAEVRDIFSRGGTILGSTNRGNPFKYVHTVRGKEVTEDRSSQIIATIGTLGLDGLIAIGGDGTLSIANELSHLGANVIGVPKTIDNDLAATDTTFGFFTAVETAMGALDRLKTTGESHDRVMILEVMGRDAGWIALESGLTGGAHVILIPEIPYKLDAVLKKIRARWDEEGRNFTLIVVAEGAFPHGGKAQYVDHGRKGSVARLGGAGATLEQALREQLETWQRPRGAPEVRTTVLGHIQRGGSPCAYDRLISLRFGAEAARLAMAGAWNRMVCLRGMEIQNVPLAEGISRPHGVDPHGQLVAQARAVGISFGD